MYIYAIGSCNWVVLYEVKTGTHETTDDLNN
jgi:hypothetical protein